MGMQLIGGHRYIVTACSTDHGDDKPCSDCWHSEKCECGRGGFVALTLPEGFEPDPTLAIMQPLRPFDA